MPGSIKKQKKFLSNYCKVQLLLARVQLSPGVV